ncbi:MAG: Late competence development protein ComFB [Pelotomaculum sp. PtaB.Bin013]|uniref:Late competence development ComFB family protein n=1 Tax=Pelotomaculum isophthalicicum JI TaxID=947010 RepID=A0A9X4H6V4_9FIRM|nr:late competence development ComFB family protein [Pelotomaculum isophthalicicum]MDF9409248.1 late competence development ComFB family protein [Pelotomaculum isophthalicicum JI]OPX89340.1 MAG: Late competence development protein ComFB [Pelotomaculum sp. PtaB.Bin013]
MLRLVNVMEILVRETIDDILRNYQEICKCERCKLDMAAIALNKLSPSYVVTAEGEVLLRVGSLKQQNKVDIIRVVTEAIDIVSKKPHHLREEN